MELYLADTGDFRFVDRALVMPGKFAVGNKMTTSQDWYFNVYSKMFFMSSGALIESMMQTGVLTVTTREDVNDRLMLFNSCKSVGFYDVVRPGEILEMKAILLSYRHGVAHIIAIVSKKDIDPVIIGEADCTLISPRDIVKMC